MGGKQVDPEAAGGLDRRQLLKAGAWAAPILVFATASPAAAASGDVTLEFTHASVFYSWANGHKTAIEVTTGVQTESAVGASTEDVTLVFGVQATGLSTTATPTLVTGVGWSTTGPGVPDGNGNLAFTFVWGGTLLANGNTGELRFDLAGEGTELDGVTSKSWTMVASSAGAIAVATSGLTFRALDPGEPIPPVPPL